jgi:hypothetical protein
MDITFITCVSRTRPHARAMCCCKTLLVVTRVCLTLADTFSMW